MDLGDGISVTPLPQEPEDDTSGNLSASDTTSSSKSDNKDEEGNDGSMRPTQSFDADAV